MGVLTYLDLADDLEQQLRRTSPGTRVVSEHELARERGVSRPTARAALQELERRYLVRRVRGAGTFVRRRIDYVIGPDTAPSWSDSVRAAGSEPTSTVERLRTGPASAEVRHRLELADGTSAVSLMRSTAVDGWPAGLTTSHLPGDLAGDLAARIDERAPGTRHVSLYRILVDDLGVDPVRTWTTASLEIPPPDVSARMGFDAPEPAWSVESVNRDRATRRPVELARSWMRADVYRIVLEQGTAPGGDGR